MAQKSNTNCVEQRQATDRLRRPTRRGEVTHSNGPVAGHDQRQRRTRATVLGHRSID